MTTVNEGVLERLRKLVEGMGIEDGDAVTELIVIGKTSNLEDGRVGICYNWDSKDWVIRSGMLHAAMDIEDEQQISPRERED